MNTEFETQQVNPSGLSKIRDVRIALNQALNEILHICPEPSRELSIARTKLEEAGFFAVKAVCLDPKNQNN